MDLRRWVFGVRCLTVLGQQGLVEYAMDQNENQWYRFLADRPEARESWKLVAR